MRDPDIRRDLLSLIRNSAPGALVVDELAVCGGDARVDVARIDDAGLTGYEIKSQCDSARRLPGQVDAYSRVFDHMWLVAASNQLENALRIVPSWWGAYEAVPLGDRVRLCLLRRAQPNPGQDAYAVAQLLWRDEALDILRERGAARGVMSKPRRRLWRRLADRVPLDELSAAVVAKLRARHLWKVVNEAA
jgi:hypothetical protein